MIASSFFVCAWLLGDFAVASWILWGLLVLILSAVCAWAFARSEKGAALWPVGIVACGGLWAWSVADWIFSSDGDFLAWALGVVLSPVSVALWMLSGVLFLWLSRWPMRSASGRWPALAREARAARWAVPALMAAALMPAGWGWVRLVPCAVLPFAPWLWCWLRDRYSGRLTPVNTELREKV